jgi:hypothetical protein
VPDKVVFISHAGKDKSAGKIDFLVDYLTSRNDAAPADRKLKFFIDRPGDMGIDANAAVSRGIIGLSVDPSDPFYKQQLRQQVKQCDFMIGILSKALTRERDIWNFELSVGLGLDKLTCCKIEDVDVDDVNELISELQWMDLTGDKNSARVRASLDVLYDIIIRKVYQSGAETRVSQASAFRAIPSGVALGIGREDSRYQVRRSAELYHRKAIAPVVISGPENELILRFPEMLKLGDKLDIIDRSGFRCHVADIRWPRPGSPDFAGEYRMQLAEALVLSEFDEDVKFSQKIQSFGHHFVPRSVILVDGYRERRRIVGEVDAWVRFWAETGIRGGTEQGIAPLLLLVFDRASVGWDERDPAVPPSPKEARALNRQNRELLDALATLAAPAPAAGLTVFRPPLQPVRRQQFYDWVDDIDDAYFDGDQKAKVRAWYDGYPGKTAADDLGVPLEDLHKYVVEKLDALQGGAG